MGETCGKCNVSDISDSIHLYTRLRHQWNKGINWIFLSSREAPMKQWIWVRQEGVSYMSWNRCFIGAYLRKWIFFPVTLVPRRCSVYPANFKSCSVHFLENSCCSLCDVFHLFWEITKPNLGFDSCRTENWIPTLCARHHKLELETVHGQAVRRNYLPGGNMYNICRLHFFLSPPQ